MGRLFIAVLLLVVLLILSSTMGCDLAWEIFQEGEELYAQGQYEEAIEKYTEVISFCSPEWEGPYHRRGMAYCALGQFERGIQDYDIAIQISPEYGDTYYSRGVAYAELGRTAEAIADFEKFISLDDIDNTDWIEVAQHQIEELSR